MRSHLLVGKVRHRRATPFVYELEHDVYYFALDLSELDEVVRRLRLVARNRRAIVSFRDADHLPTPATDLPVDIRAHLRSEGIEAEGWRITLVTTLRVLGYTFNPASFFLCRDEEGTLRVVVVEVHNTFGERHLYTLRPSAEGGANALAAPMDKVFFVSPFISLDGRYSATVRDEPDGLRIGIGLRQDDRPTLSTSLVLSRRRLTDRTLLRQLLRIPVTGQRTMALILWHALRLKLRGAPFFRHSMVAGPGGLAPGVAAHGMAGGTVPRGGAAR